MTTAVTCQFGKHICLFYIFSCSPKIAFYKTLIFSTQTEETPTPFENACDLQSLYNLSEIAILTK